MECHEYITISAGGEGKVVDRKSVFLSFAFPLHKQDTAEAEDILKTMRKKYYDARHVCYAFVLMPDGAVERQSDNGEPSGTAGRPILGAIRSAQLTQVLVVVVRYFGGIKLGTPGLIAAYRAAAEQALQAAPRVKRIVQKTLTLRFPYTAMNAVMQVVKRYNLHIVDSRMDNECLYRIEVPQAVYEIVRDTFLKADTIDIEQP